MMKINPLVIGIAGGTGSGKTTVTRAILNELKKFGDEKNVILLEQDSYYKYSEKPFEERIKENYDHPDSIDFDLLISHIEKLKNGIAIEKPIYDFVEYNRCAETEIVEPKSIIVVEGILVLAIQSLRDMFDMKVFVDTDDDERLLRRIERDIKERGRTFENIKEHYLNTVKPMHLEFVTPSKRYADIIIPRGKENIVAIKMVASRLRTLIK